MEPLTALQQASLKCGIKKGNLQIVPKKEKMAFSK